jgi:hypothetical protein
MASKPSAVESGQTEHVQRFNLETMSGVFPGTRTAVFQRVRLWPRHKPAAGPIWAQILWTDEPFVCLVYRQDDAGRPILPPLVQLDAPSGVVHEQLAAALAEVGWFAQSCGSCRFWQATTAQSADGLRAGVCRVVPEVDLPPELALQSALALDCPRWAAVDETVAAVEIATAALAPGPLPKIAEISESKLKFWPRLQRRVQRWFHGERSTPRWAERLVERSGVGAGTESCFACQGRIANLGALAVATPEGDTQTFSIWRCRSCFTLYLNDWIDRWVRLESLETEERYYRIAPAEALELLAVIEGVAGAEHPGRRHERTAQRLHFVNFLANRTPLSYQIRQGR